MQKPSKKWKSQKLAVLESVENWLQKRLMVCSVFHAGALGFFLQWWISQNFESAFPLTVVGSYLVIVAVFLLGVFGLVAVVLSCFIFELRKRMQ